MEQAVQKKEDSLSSTTAQRLRDARLEKGLSMWELSRRAGISQPQISLLERGKYQLKRKAGEKLAEALDVGVDWLVSGDERKRLY
ncbi:MAG: helix-turn-helix transcriptional regulator [Candidatus Faecousia sp.]|nr:helix-turn-helix transcriptional regulator [Candidatus Faecousia sp.]